MKKTILLVFSLTIGGCIFSSNIKSNMDSISVEQNRVEANEANRPLTMKEFTTFLNSKKEHYPLSDEFIEKYQQAGGGYIEKARSLGMLVDKEQHEPNQKWHFFTSWYEASLEDGSVSEDSNPQKVVYNRLLCPELLLWIYEASGVNPNKVKLAKEVAEIGRAKGTAVTSIAKSMREQVPYEDIYQNTIAFLEGR